ncbi:MAG: helix-turn-helix domain-containing protein, partial [Firmicutes bacterium]|nr:helix-turn-helix domain-containing protein [Bacillota bacterium]
HNAAYRMLNTGELKAIRNGRVWRIPKQAIIEFTKEKANLIWSPPEMS